MDRFIVTVADGNRDEVYDPDLRRLLRFSFFMRFRCHFQRICRFFFHRRLLLFINARAEEPFYKAFFLW